MDSTYTLPRRSPINFRLIALVAIPSVVFLWVLYQPISQAITHGVENHGDYSKVDLKSLGYFNMDQSTGTIHDVPPAYRALDGKKVQLEGFMFAGQSAAGQLSDFQFVYNIQKCCFNGPPLVQERIFAHVPNGKKVPFIDQFTRLTGILHVKVTRNAEDVIQSVYTIDVEKAEPRG